MHDLDYGTEDLIHQFCRDNRDMLGCGSGELCGYKCLDKCLNAVFKCIDGIDKYEDQKACMGEVHTLNSVGSLCIAGACF